VRISGSRRENRLSGTTGWETVEFEFEVAEAVRQVELVAELRAKKGKAWFEAESLIISRKKS
jgi:hypothetical protein